MRSITYKSCYSKESDRCIKQQLRTWKRNYKSYELEVTCVLVLNTRTWQISVPFSSAFGEALVYTLWGGTLPFWSERRVATRDKCNKDRNYSYVLPTLVPECPDSRNQCTSNCRGSGLSTSTSFPLSLKRSFLVSGYFTGARLTVWETVSNSTSILTSITVNTVFLLFRRHLFDKILCYSLKMCRNCFPAAKLVCVMQECAVES